MQYNHMILMIFLMACVTYIARVLPVFIPIERIPTWFKEMMHLIPVVVITAIISTSVFVHDGQLQLMTSVSYILASAVTVSALVLTKSSGGAVAIGLGTHMLFKLITT